MGTTEMVKSEEALRQELTVVQIQNLQIVDQQSYDHAERVLLDIKAWRKRWETYWYGENGKTGPVAQAHATWKSLLAKFNEADDSAKKSEAIVKNKILAWDDQQREIQRKQQEEKDRIAREKEEADRQAKAAEMEVEGLSEEDVEAVLTAPSEAVAEVVEIGYQKSSAISRRDNWCCEVTDLKALLKAIGAGKFKLTPDQTIKTKEFFESLLKPQAVANSSTWNAPGCRAVNRPTVGVRPR